MGGKCQQCKGMIFKEKYLGGKIDPVVIVNKKIKSVASYTLDGTFVKVFDSVTLASKEVGSQTTNISHACENPLIRICKGFKWGYVD